MQLTQLQKKSLLKTIDFMINKHIRKENIIDMPICILNGFLGRITNRNITNIVLFARTNGINIKIINEILTRMNMIGKNNLQPNTLTRTYIIANKIDMKINRYRMKKEENEDPANIPESPQLVSFDLNLRKYVLISGKIVDETEATKVMRRKRRQTKKAPRVNTK